MRHVTLAAVSAVALTIFSVPGDAQTRMRADPMNTPADLTPEDAPSFVRLAGASDLYEIQSSQLALTKAKRPQVRQFAQMLIRHHKQTTRDVTAAARAARMNPPPPRLLPMQADMLAALRRAPRSDFDRVYLDQQIPAHEMALALHGNYARNGDTRPLKTAARTAVPIVQSHLDQARRLDRR